MEGNACISGSIGSLYSVYTVKYVKGMEPLMRASKFEAHTLTESQMHILAGGIRYCRQESRDMHQVQIFGISAMLAIETLPLCRQKLL